MSPPTVTEQRVYSKGIRCRHRGLPISVNCFRKSKTLPNCYLFHKQCNDCRSTGGRIAEAYALPTNIPPASLRGFQRRSVMAAKINLEASKTGGFHQFTQRIYNSESRVEFHGCRRCGRVRVSF